MKKGIAKKLFGINVCSDHVLKKYMNLIDYYNYIKTKEAGLPLNKKLATKIAKAMKIWAIKNGVTHYSHWFAPLTGKTAEKQVSFIEPTKNGSVIETFSANSLIKGETDASSFPNGGERVTFEARGYTVWDYTSPAFIKSDNKNNKTLFIPTAFCSYNGTALDEKTPLLRSLESLNKESIRVLHALGYSDVKKVVCNIGGEQEYFLIKNEMFEKREDLKVTNRTLLGKESTKSQEVTSHYFGIIEDEVSAFMHDVDKELWKLGIMAKLQHNEVAPSQHELVPIFAPANISSDQNQLIMETINKMASKYGFKALFHEKPFNNINGSGKHINWSLCTNTGLNLFDSNIADKNLFLIFFTAMIKAINSYYKVIRLSTAHRGNDLRLGGNEAPPTLISVFIGDNIEKMLTNLTDSTTTKKEVLDVGVKSMIKAKKDFCDRNRTSPFAYTSNKFEFRMVGSSQTIAWPCTCINTIMAKVLNEFATYLENNGATADNIKELISTTYAENKRIVFNGNSYDNSWKTEATKRGLMEYKTTTECLKIYDDADTIELFESTNVLNESELKLRKATTTKAYAETVKIEALTLINLIYGNVTPSINNYILSLNEANNHTNTTSEFKSNLIKKLNATSNSLLKLIAKLESEITTLDLSESAKINTSKLDNIIKLMDEIRIIYDSAEHLIDNKLKPFPTYNNLLFN